MTIHYYQLPSVKHLNARSLRFAVRRSSRHCRLEPLSLLVCALLQRHVTVR
jgi:hypothetical protein